MEVFHINTLRILLSWLVVSMSVAYHVLKEDNILAMEPNGSVLTTSVSPNDPLLKFSEAETIQVYRGTFFEDHESVNAWKSLPKTDGKSFWDVNQRRRLHSAIKRNHYDIVVLPLQQKTITYDKSARLLVARFLADDISQRTKKKVMPVELAQRLLGEQKYQFSDEDISSLMQNLGAEFSVSLYLKTDPNNPEQHTMSAVMNSKKGLGGYYQKKLRTADDDNSLSSIASRIMPEYADALFGKSVKNFPSTLNEGGYDFSLPKTLEDVALEERAIANAAYFQLFGILTPDVMREERRRYFERSLVALRQTSAQSPEIDTLKSRALFYLHRRPEALKLVQSPKTLAQRALLSFLNGNYYDLEKQWVDIQFPLLRVFSYIEYQRLSTEYEIFADNGDIGSIPIYWKNLISYAADDANLWKVQDNTEFFKSISGLFPAFDETLLDTQKTRLSMNLLSGKYDSGDLLFASALADLEKVQNPGRSQIFEDAHLTRFDATHFYQTLALSNILRNLNLRVNKQHLVDSANSLVEIVAPVLEGQRTFDRLRAESLATAAELATEIEKPQILKSLYELTSAVTNGSGVTDYNWIKVRSLHHKFRTSFNKYLALNIEEATEPDKYLQDWPSAVAYFDNVRGSHRKDYVNSDFPAVARLHGYTFGAAKDRVLKDLKARFEGHPEKIQYLSKVLEEQGDESGAEKLLRTAVKQGTHSWEVYDRLSTKLWKDGQFDEMFEIAMSYPAFQENSRENAVAVANRASHIGDMFYWKGAIDFALPFYRISANSNTGSYSSMASAQRLALIEGDIIEAAQIARRNSSRYNSSYRYRDYISYLHMFGFNEEADTLFNGLVGQFDDPHLWSALFVGDRVVSKQLDEMVGSVKRFLETRDLRFRLSQRYILMQALTDRLLLEESVGSVLDALSDRYYSQKVINDIHSRRLSSYLQTNMKERVENDEFPGVVLADFEAESQNKNFYKVEMDYSLIPTRYQQFTKAYHALKHKNFDVAIEHFSLFELYYPIHVESENQTLAIEILPYVVISAVETGRAANIAAYLKDAFDENEIDTYDYRVSKAILSAFEGNLDDSMLQLEKAFLKMPHVGSRGIFTWYQLFEICEWISNVTNERDALEFALEKARVLQIIHPVYSWSYAFEAKYSQEDERRVRAAAIAEYLDKESYWLTGVPESIRQKAEIWMKHNNPFSVNKNAAASNEI